MFLVEKNCRLELIKQRASGVSIPIKDSYDTPSQHTYNLINVMHVYNLKMFTTNRGSEPNRSPNPCF